MAASNLADLLDGGGEDLGVEYKAWLDLTDPEIRAKLAKHLGALANHGGGYIIIGVDDKTRLPLGSPPPSLPRIDQEAVAGIVKRYLSPPFQIQIETVAKGGVGYPVVIVPSHGQRPVMAVADGPTGPKGQPVGVSQGRIYIRASGPQSVEIRTPDDWNALLDRCLSHRGDQLAKIMRQGLSRPDRPSRAAIHFLSAAIDSTAYDFSHQAASLAHEVSGPDQTWLSGASKRFSALGYALLDAEGEAIELTGLRGLIDRASRGMEENASAGWSAFYPIVGVPERAPQLRSERLGDTDASYLEGMRLAKSGMLWGSVDYWRLYEGGVGVWVDSYRSDAVRAKEGGEPYLIIAQVLYHLHSTLAHARLIGQEISGVTQVAVRQDWRGLTGRSLAWERRRVAVPGTCVDDSFAKTIVLSWAELRDDYFQALRRVAIAFLDAFPPSGGRSPAEWLTREIVDREFAKFEGGTVRLFDD